MIGVFYLILCFCIGWVICSFAFPKLDQYTKTDCFKRKISVNPYMLLVPAWFVTGTLALTWAVYLTAYLYREAKQPLLYADWIVMPAACIVIAFATMKRRHRKNIKVSLITEKDRKTLRYEVLFLLAVSILAVTLMRTTFFVKSQELYIGVSVFSDFSPHIAMIRSFSHGNNFPTAYPHYAGEDIRYHFMFQFLAGNLEYLGLRIDYAFNIPSILSFISAFMLLYLLAVKITGKLSAGIFACLFFAFRSSKTLFTYLAGLPEGTKLLDALSQNRNFISSTPNEDWGLWNLNVYCNQRHFAFGLAVVFFLLILFLPNLYEMFEDITRYRQSRRSVRKKAGSKGMKSSGKKTGELQGIIRLVFFTKESWMGKDKRTAVSAGILLGSLSFFHGAAVIGVLIILFVMAVFSKRRLEYLITALIAVALALLQAKFFIHGAAVSMKFFFGFLAENKTIFGVASYLERLLGVLPLVLLIAFYIQKAAGKYLLFAFLAPLFFAFTVLLTVDVAVNHKYIMMSCILLGIFAAAAVAELLEQRNLWSGMIGIFLFLLLTATGVYDFTTVLKKNTPDTAVVLELQDPLTQWVDENSTSQDIFLTSNYTVNQVVLGGAMLYEGWQYYPWSAGYDTDYRTEQVKQMYEASQPEELAALIKAENIRYIIVDHDNRISTDYILNENTIQETYACVYFAGEGEWKTSIYDTQKQLR